MDVVQAASAIADLNGPVTISTNQSAHARANMASQMPTPSISTPATSIGFPLTVDKLDSSAASQVPDDIENLNFADLSIYDLVTLLGSPIARQSSIESCAAETSVAKVRDIFTCFPNLPLELQRKVWSFAADIPRLLEFRYFLRKNHVECDERSPFHGRKIRDDLKSTSPQPALLDVCRESRTESLKKYQHVEADPNQGSLPLRVVDDTRARSLSKDGIFSFNLKVDTLLLSDVRVVDALCGQYYLSPQQAIWQHSKCLAISYRTKQTLDFDDWDFAQALALFVGLITNVNTIIVVISEKATGSQKGDMQLVPLSRQDTSPLKHQLSAFIRMIQRFIKKSWPYVHKGIIVRPQARTFKVMGITKGGVRL